MLRDKLPATLVGVVTKYKGNGRKLGYPTANFKSVSTLADGVYFGFATMGQYHHQPALIFIGVPTTVGDSERRVEAHLLDVKDQDYYGLKLELELRHFHRANQAFDSIDELLLAMKVDEQTGREWFEQHVLASDSSLADT